MVAFTVFSACKKTAVTTPAKTDTTKTTPVDTTKTTPPDTTKTTNSGCKLVQEYFRGTANIPLLYKFEYDANGYPSKISTYNNGVLSLGETVQPDYMEFKETGSTALYQGVKYDNPFLTKLPTTYSISDAYGTNRYAGFYTYDSKSRLSTIRGGVTGNGVLVDSLATTITFYYDAGSNVSKVTYTYRNQVVKTFTTKGFDTHVTPYHNIKDSFFLEHDFILFGTDYDNMRYLIERLSTNNLLGYTYVQNDTGTSYTEDYKYTYDEKGQPIERDAATSLTGQPATGGYVDAWTYQCN